MSSEGERGRRLVARQGNIISHEPASDSSTVQNVLGFIQDYVPAVTGSKGDRKERVLWAHFERADLSDVTGLGVGEGRGGGGGGGDGRQDPLLLVLGVSSGFSVWLIPPGGDAREVYCCYGDGETARTVHLLPTPDQRRGGAGEGGEDQFSSQRPIIAVVKKGRSAAVGVAYSTLQLLSLRATNTDTLVKKFQFKGKPILSVHGNRRVIAVVFKKRVLVIDAASLTMRFSIKNNYPLDHIVNPVALGHCWLALTETKLSAKYHSNGGVCQSQLPSVATTVIKSVKKGLTALSDTLSGLTSKVQPGTEPSDSPPQSSDHSTANVITVLDINYAHPEEVRLHEAGRVEGGVVAHFLATAERGSHIAAIAFNPSGNLLVVASTDGHSFNVFHLVPHPWLSSEAAVHHMYTLFRGATSASVQDISVSWDSRWVSVSTLNGTSHIFPVTPYGGEVTVRTHMSNRVVNKLSRFHTSAGIETMATQSHSHVNTPSPSVSISSPTPHTSHSPPHEGHIPTSPPNPITWNNSRGAPLPTPQIVKALHQIKQPYLTTDEGSFVSGSISSGGGSSSSLPTGDSSSPWLGGPAETQCVRTFFSPFHQNGERNSADSPSVCAMYTLFVLGGSGTLTRYSMQPRPHEGARDGDDAPITLDCHAHLCWRLLSKPHTPAMKLPLAEDNPLISTTNEHRTITKRGRERGEGGGRERGEGGGGERGEGGGRERGEGGGKGEGEWLSQVELLTHATPTRRLWMGPQFSFKTYHSHTTVLATSPGQAGSSGGVVLATGNLISLSPDPSHQRPLSAESGESAVLSPSHDTLLSDLFQHLPELTTSPIPMPTRSGSQPRELGTESGSHSMERGVVEVYGSWNKMAPQLEASQSTDVAERLAEAMGDHTLSPPLTHPQVTVAAKRSGHASTGFQTASDQPL